MSRKKKQKQLSKEEYVKNYCGEKRIRGRYAVYVDETAHYNLIRITGLFKGEYHTTTSSLADAIINHHFEVNWELLGGLLQEEKEQFLEDLRSRRTKMDEEPEDEDCDDEPLPD